MLWVAVACLQREEPSLVCVVYTGDVVHTSKDEMIAKVQVSTPRSFMFHRCSADL